MMLFVLYSSSINLTSNLRKTWYIMFSKPFGIQTVIELKYLTWHLWGYISYSKERQTNIELPWGIATTKSHILKICSKKPYFILRDDSLRLKNTANKERQKKSSKQNMFCNVLYLFCFFKRVLKPISVAHACNPS
jgi:hypothetical protein